MLFLLQYETEDIERFEKLVNDNELLDFIDMLDCYPIVDFKIFKVEYGKVERVFYTGWQPHCIIQIVDNNKNVVLSGYGTDH